MVIFKMWFELYVLENQAINPGSTYKKVLIKFYKSYFNIGFEKQNLNRLNSTTGSILS